MDVFSLSYTSLLCITSYFVQFLYDLLFSDLIQEKWPTVKRAAINQKILKPSASKKKSVETKFGNVSAELSTGRVVRESKKQDDLLTFQITVVGHVTYRESPGL